MNKPKITKLVTMPDVANEPHRSPEGTLDWVGMSDIHQPLIVDDAGISKSVHSRVQVFVDLNDAQAAGIHMSRLYLTLDTLSESQALTVSSLKQLLHALIVSHAELSTRAFIQFDFDYFIRRKALVSDHSGWASYPVTLKGTLVEGEVNIELGISVLYSATCPCSAALARQLIQAKFAEDFAGHNRVGFDEVKQWLGSGEAIHATPHSQRSTARVLVCLDDSLEHFPITELIDSFEAVLKTPVQAAVKREDEQEFARLNGENPMFCEDAGRKLKASLEEHAGVNDFWVRVQHHESLHAHDAVSVFTKGVDGGYLPIP